jgi:hypothetical protein
VTVSNGRVVDMKLAMYSCIPSPTHKATLSLLADGLMHTLTQYVVPLPDPHIKRQCAVTDGYPFSHKTRRA